MSNTLEHLTEKEVDELIRRYYENENVNTLLLDYSIHIHPNMLYLLFPSQPTGEKCLYCGNPVVIRRVSRSSRRASHPECEACGHVEGETECGCTYCREFNEWLVESRKARKREAIEKLYDPARFKTVKEEELGFEERVYLAAVLRACLSEDTMKIHPIQKDLNIAPTQDMLHLAVHRLIDKGILLPHTDSPISSFADGEDFPERFFLFDVSYRLMVVPEGKEMQLMNPDPSLFTDDAFLLTMWASIAYEEVMEYLLYSLEKVRFELNPGEKTKTVFQELLKHYSVGQVCNIIYGSIAKASRYYQEVRITRKHAANSVITHCQRFGERAIAEGWVVKGFSRNYNLPQSVLSEVFFNRIAKIGSKGFDQVPAAENLRTYKKQEEREHEEET